MNVMILKILLIALSLSTLSSCSLCEPDVRYVEKPYRVNVPVKCVVQDANCSFNRNSDTEIVSSLLECIINMKNNEESCK